MEKFGLPGKGLDLVWLAFLVLTASESGDSWMGGG
jgi:hypothetical protein